MFLFLSINPSTHLHDLVRMLSLGMLVAQKSMGEDDEGEKEDRLQISPVFKLVTRKGLQSSFSSSLTITQVLQALRVCVLIDVKLRSLRNLGGFSYIWRLIL